MSFLGVLGFNKNFGNKDVLDKEKIEIKVKKLKRNVEIRDRYVY